jgi:Flp pilus assembly protein TadD
VDVADVHNNLAAAALRQGKFEEAVWHCQQALQWRPDFAEAHHNLATALIRRGRIELALNHCKEALRLRPDHPAVHNNFASVLLQQGKVEEAVACCREALRLRPDYPEALNNLGNALAIQDNLDEAAAQYQRALELKPEFAEARTNLGNVRKYEGRFDEALVCYDQALAQEPSHGDRHFNRALLQLLTGNWSEGWPEYEWRWQSKGFPRYSFREPRWDGSPLAERTLLVHTEQGLGDTIQFIRYALILQNRHEGKVIVRCQPALVKLLTSVVGRSLLVPEGTRLPPLDCYVPLLSLPGILGTTPSDVSAAVPYLGALQQLVAQWRQRLLTFDIRHSTSDFLVGIAWQGSAAFPGDRLRSIPLKCFAPVESIKGIRLISLQKDNGNPEYLSTSVPECLPNLDEASGPFMDTAAIMVHLDLVICSDTAVAHLAGALGVPVWLALPAVPDWRWLLQREDSPWYPTMRIFRQTRSGHWEEVFERIAAELQRVVGCGNHL